MIKVEHHALSGTAAMYAGRNSPRTWQACTTIDYQMIHKSLASQWLTGRLLTTCLLYIACYWLKEDVCVCVRDEAILSYYFFRTT